MPDESDVLVAPAPHLMEIQERAQIDMMIATAKRFPRPDWATIRERMTKVALMDEETAASCFYVLKRTDSRTKEQKNIEGPGVRLAEIATVMYQNIRAGARVIANDGRKVTSQGFCFDLENNILIMAETHRKIVDRDGRPYSEDMQIVTANAANSIARRNAIFQVVPMALVKPVYEACKEFAVGDAQKFEKRRASVFGRFAQMGVKRDQILAALECESIDQITREDLATLIGLGTAIKDGDISIEEAFNVPDEPAAEEGVQKPREKLIAHLEKLKAKGAK
jgi:hypothetical protein